MRRKSGQGSFWDDWAWHFWDSKTLGLCLLLRSRTLIHIDRPVLASVGLREGLRNDTGEIYELLEPRSGGQGLMWGLRVLAIAPSGEAVNAAGMSGGTSREGSSGCLGSSLGSGPFPLLPKVFGRGPQRPATTVTSGEKTAGLGCGSGSNRAFLYKT
ncbi:hypothetical protein K458DRAFT_39786 [Lentithecium fluviatile CBS 122367]|uniref:Uncharacterized protein n=1 Tax=Lentithecium fluviatile CBS 122367 TaxID=1168545 RepID=A0A6G1J059_9PLEO|nr:hypothetical protein K458DRAFT_39786 [Lentithecium fluviatile CBS 122367]